MTDLPTWSRSFSKAGQTQYTVLFGSARHEGGLEIETVGIVSASNEAGQQLTEAENDPRDEHLRRDLAGYRSRHVRGRFGDVGKPFLSMVNPFIVVNMTRETAIALGAKYHQFHVIFGAREGADGDVAWRFELVEADGAARVLAVRKLYADADRQRLYLGAGCPQDRGHYFVIPGVDEDDLTLFFDRRWMTRIRKDRQPGASGSTSR